MLPWKEKEKYYLLLHIKAYNTNFQNHKEINKKKTQKCYLVHSPPTVL